MNGAFEWTDQGHDLELEVKMQPESWSTQPLEGILLSTKISHPSSFFAPYCGGQDCTKWCQSCQNEMTAKPTMFRACAIESVSRRKVPKSCQTHMTWTDTSVEVEYPRINPPGIPQQLTKGPRWFSRDSEGWGTLSLRIWEVVRHCWESKFPHTRVLLHTVLISWRLCCRRLGPTANPAQWKH